MFSQSTAGRPAPGLGGNRLQNGTSTPSAATSWLPAAASRSTFAQTLGGQQAPLDLSEFPSLGSPAQQQNLGAAQSMWATNSTIRAPAQQQQPAIQRTPAPPSSQSQAQDESSQFGPGSEAYRFGGAGPLAGLAQTPSQGQGDEFPPLADNDRRGSLLSTFGASSSLAVQSSRHGLDPVGDMSLRNLGDRNPTPRGRTLTNPNPFPLPESTQTLGLGAGLGGASIGSGFANAGPVGYRGRNGFPEQTSNSAMSPELGYNQTDALNMAAPQPTRRQVSGQSSKKRLSEMTPQERNGLVGLAAKLDPDHPDFSQLAAGHDLTQLGLELNRPDSTPLYATFATPFGPPNQAQRPAVPDFTLPSAYRVQNVPPLHTKIPSMSDEGLMAVFYTMPRDLAQEMAAQELYNRDWRWHMRHRIWLQKDPSYAAPTRIDSKQERGFYIIFNVNLWKKERREILLNYDDLEHRQQAFTNGNAYAS
ncbi:hypothetical protein BT63DRAFT_423572 [Microthyrium microscopicum]|uniref:NOT2/NOT3/NOT5 C-terminal domain-containing protein n=1 Tax=Microthyrium microscopicum TaxID=703497 RepID=A0A6A6UI46_9PEZI|nr:hypothetical protein BT63DRAFT_423572 [Microthyrium microscopicum]